MTAERTLSAAPEAAPLRYVVGLDVGSETCSAAVLHPDKSVLLKPFLFANTGAGFTVLDSKLAQLGCPPYQVVVGLEATGRYAFPIMCIMRLAHAGAKLKRASCHPEHHCNLIPSNFHPIDYALQDRALGREIGCFQTLLHLLRELLQPAHDSSESLFLLGCRFDLFQLGCQRCCSLA